MWFVSDRSLRVVATDDQDFTPLELAVGDSVVEHVANDYRSAYKASWDALFDNVGAVREFDTLIENDDSLWRVSLREESFLSPEGDVKVRTELAPKYRIEAQTPPVEAQGDVSIADSPPPAEDSPGIATWPSATEWAALVGIVIIATILRLWDLNALPSGLHGDEAITGMEGWRVAEQGNIGVYTVSALGQPTLMYYPLAVAQWIFGDSVFTLRAFAALGGVLSIMATWWATRVRFGPVAAGAAAAALAVMVWSVHYSRIAFNLAWWPLVGIVALYLLDTAMETNNRWRWALAGFFTALGIYIYNAHWIFGFAIGLFVAAWTVMNRKRLREVGPGLALFAGVGLLTIVPMLAYMLDARNNYSSHMDTIGIQATEQWGSATTGGRIGLLASAYGGAWMQLLGQPDIDYVDASGILKPIGLPLIAAAIAGMVILALRYRSRTFALLITVMAIMPLAPALTQAGQGWLRRDYLLAPLFAILVGVFMATLIDATRQRVGPLSLAAIATLPFVVIALITTNGYFSTFRNDPTQQWVFVAELSEPARVMAAYDDVAFINFYSARHSVHYETLQYLTPGTVGIDRSNEFSDRPGFDIVEQPEQAQLFVLVGDYASKIPELTTAHQGAVVSEGTSGGVPYAAYLVEPNVS